MSQFIYRVLTTAHAHRMMDWAEQNNVDYDVWNAEESIAGSPTTELGLTQWPNEWKSM